MDRCEKVAWCCWFGVLVTWILGFFALLFAAKPVPLVKAASQAWSPRYGNTIETETAEHMKFRFKGVEDRLSRLEDKLDTLSARLTRQTFGRVEKNE